MRRLRGLSMIPGKWQPLSRNDHAPRMIERMMATPA
jgi:hypothetical protein